MPEDAVRGRLSWIAHHVGVVLSAVLALAIAWVTLLPTPPIAPPPFVISDKVSHLVAFAALTLPAAVLSRFDWRAVVLVVFGYGLLIEIIQPSVGRSGEYGDLLANAIGIALGASIGCSARRVLRSVISRRVLQR